MPYDIIQNIWSINESVSISPQE